MRALAFLLAGFLLFGCIVSEERQESFIPGQNASYNVSQELPPADGAHPPNETVDETLQEPTQALPEFNITYEINNTPIENITEKNYYGLEFDNYTVLLEDLAPRGSEYCALVKIVTIEGASMREFGRAQICPGESYYWVSPEHHKYRIKVIETASGYSGRAAWANIVVYR